jgi:hypothetical protein
MLTFLAVTHFAEQLLQQLCLCAQMRNVGASLYIASG